MFTLKSPGLLSVLWITFRLEAPLQRAADPLHSFHDPKPTHLTTHASRRTKPLSTRCRPSLLLPRPQTPHTSRRTPHDARLTLISHDTSSPGTEVLDLPVPPVAGPRLVDRALDLPVRADLKSITKPYPHSSPHHDAGTSSTKRKFTNTHKKNKETGPRNWASSL